MLNGKEETCFFIDAEIGQYVELEFIVLNSNPNNARPELITGLIEDSSGNMIWHPFRKAKGRFKDHYVTQSGEYKICFKAT